MLRLYTGGEILKDLAHIKGFLFYVLYNNVAHSPFLIFCSLQLCIQYATYVKKYLIREVWGEK